MTQKRILRANARKVVRERELRVADAFRLHDKDVDDPAITELLDELATEDPADTAQALFDIANRLIDQLAEETGAKRSDLVARLRRI